MKKICAAAALLAAVGLVLLMPGCLNIGGNILGTVAPPTANPAGRSVDGGTSENVTLTSTTEGATIYYTLDNTAPKVGSSLFCASGATISLELTTSGSTTIRAIAAKPGWSSSAEMRETYQLTVAVPTATPPGGTYTSDQSITLSCTTEDSAIYYTLDGSDPSATSGTLFDPTVPITILGDSRITLKAVGVKAGMADSGVMVAQYTL
jgi:hypothetical protein